MEELVSGLFIVFLIYFLFFFQRKGAIRQIREQKQTKEVNENIIKGQEEKVQTLIERAEDLESSITVFLEMEASAKQRVESAETLAEKSFELEAAKRRDEFERKMAKELEELEKSSSKAQLQNELDQLNTLIQEHRAEVDIINKERAKSLDDLSFVEIHSLALSTEDLSDVEVLKELAPKLSRKDIIADILWTNYYQPPLQTLRAKIISKKLTEDLCGIYKITSLIDGRIYCGQAKKIGNRWTQHVKEALKGSTDLFHTTMRQQGPENFLFEVLEVCDADDLNARESSWIEHFDTANYGLNSKKGKS